MALIDVIGLNKAPIEKSRISDEITGGLQAGIGLATAKEQIEEKKIQVAQQKEQLEMGKINSFNGMIKTLNIAKPAIAKQMAPKIKERFQSMGFDPAIIDTVMADPDFGRALFNIANEHGSELSATPENRAKMLSAYQDIGLLSEGVNYIQDVKKQAQQNKFAMEQQARQIQGQKDIAALSAETQKEIAGLKRGGLALTPGQVQADKEFAKTYEEFSAAGGKKGVEADLSALKEAKERIEQGEATRWAGAVPRFLRGYVTSDTANVQDTIENVLVKSLKTILGGAFTEKDREAIVKNAFDPSQTPENNAKQLQLKIDEIQARYDAKMEAINEYEKKGTISTLRVGNNKTATKGGLNASDQAALDKVLKQVKPEQQAAATAQFMKKIELRDSQTRK